MRRPSSLTALTAELSEYGDVSGADYSEESTHAPPADTRAHKPKFLR